MIYEVNRYDFNNKRMIYRNFEETQIRKHNRKKNEVKRMFVQ